MGWLSKLASGASNSSNKVENGVSNLFNKVKDSAPGMLDQVSDISGKIAGGLDKASDIGGKILSSPITQGLAASFGPEGEMALAGANALLSGVQKGANIAHKVSNITNQAHKVSNITNQGSYSGNSQNIQNDIYKEAKIYMELLKHRHLFNTNSSFKKRTYRKIKGKSCGNLSAFFIIYNNVITSS